MSGKDTWLQE